jgi:two-component system response regulator RpfG
MAVILDSSREHPLVAEVLIVDDQPTSRIILEKVVRGIGDNVRVRSWSNPHSALHAAQERTPDLILADYMMPGIDGIEFTRRVRALPGCRDVPIVIITVVDDRSVMYRALEAGATDFLTKPVDHYECKVRCRNLLTLRRQQLIIHNRASALEAQIRRAVGEIRERERETLYRLARAGEYHDYVSCEQQARIGRMSRSMAVRLGMDQAFCDAIEIAAPLHDIGKIAVPDRILRKEGPLAPDEAEVMRTHALIGHDILKDSPSPYLNMGASIALSHHESWDGNGYPRGLRGADIPLEGRIVAVADILDALLSERPYKQPWPVARALEEIRRLEGSRLDPGCVAALFDCLDDFLPERNGRVGARP